MTEPDIAEKVGQYAASTLFEASDDVAALAPTIAPLYRPIRLSGPAYTILADPGDNLAVHLGLAQAPPGSVLVVASGMEVEKGFWGEVMMEAALARGLRGLVTDGAVRDIEVIRERSFPVFCGGIAIPGTTKTLPGRLNEPVVLTQVLIRPGDLLVGDDDGVAVIRREKALDVVEKAQARVEKETAFLERLKQGELTVDLLGLRKKNG